MSKITFSRIIDELKTYELQNISLCDFLFIMNNLFISNSNQSTQINSNSFTIGDINKFILSAYTSLEINWKEIDNNQLEQIYHDQFKYIFDNITEWRKNQKMSLNSINSMIDEIRKIKKILKQKNLTKEQLIDSYLQQIRRNKLILAKNSPSLQSFVSITLNNNNPNNTNNTNNNTSTPQTTNPDRQKYLSNIQLLQNRISLMRNKQKFEIQNEQNLLQSYRSTQLIYSKKTQILNFIIKDLQFKKQYFEQEQKNILFESLNVLVKKLSSRKKVFIKKLYNIFTFYTRENFNICQTFQSNSVNMLKIDLRIFLKYFKKLKEINIKKQTQNQDYLLNNQRFKSTNLLAIFKKYAINQKQLNFDRFLQIHLELFLDINKIDQNNQNQINIITRKSKQPYSGHDRVQNYYSNINNNDKSLSFINPQQVPVIKQKLLNQLQKYKKLKQIFSQQKMSQIVSLNITYDYDENNQQKNKSSKKSKRNKLNQSETDNLMGNIIDRTFAQYQITRRQIYKNFLKKNKSKNQQQQNKQPKTLKNKKKSSKNHRSLQNFKKNIQNKQSKTISIKFKNNNYEYDKTNQKQTPFNKFLFDQIIMQANNEQDQDNNNNEKTFKKRSQSMNNIALINQRKNRSSSSNDKYNQKKQPFILPKIIKMSSQKIQSLSIRKSLEYLYESLGKRQQPRIKKILQIDNPQKLNTQHNKQLKEYFTQEKINTSQFQKTIITEKKKKIQIVDRRCSNLHQEKYRNIIKYS